MKRGTAFWLALLILYAIHAASALRAERVLWSDGSYYFIQIVQNQVFALGDRTRACADVLMELPLLIALRLGITDLAWLKLLFGLPAFLFTPLSLGLCLWMAGPNRGWLTYPLATFAAGSMNTELLVIHESRVALTLFWPILFALLDPLRRGSTLLVGAALSLPFIASYESAIVLGPIVMFAAFERGRGETRAALRSAAMVSFASGLIATLVAAQSVVWPTHPANLALFQKSWPVVFGEGGTGVRLSLTILSLVVLSAIPWVRANRLARLALLITAAALCVSVVHDSWNDPTDLAVDSQYRARILNVILPALAGSALLRFRRSSPPAESPARDILGILFAAQVLLQIQLTMQWEVYREVSREALACVRGLIPVDTAIAERLRERQASPQWMWGWHHPTLSYVDRPGRLGAILGVSNGYTSWQPFDPGDGNALPRLSPFGIDDHDYRSALKDLGPGRGPSWKPRLPCPTKP